MQLTEVLRHRSVRTFFQPIVSLVDCELVAYEALTRGPVGPLELPDQLFEAARAEDRLRELDDLCCSAAIRNSMALGLRAPITVFINIEAEAGDLDRFELMIRQMIPMSVDLRIAVEITERAAAVPIERLRSSIEHLRAAGLLIALDDVRGDDTLDLMRALNPDIVKLDKELVQGGPWADARSNIGKVRAFCRETGTALLAEGIETAEHLAHARDVGAQLGQGWLFGRPSPRLQDRRSPDGLRRAVVQPA